MIRKKILIVDDVPDIRHGLALRLEAAGYEVCTAGDGLEATRTAIREQPGLVLLDIGIPGGGGHAVMDRLGNLEETRHIPVVYLTASSEESDYKQARRGGARGYLLKPFDAEELLGTLEQVLASDGAHAW